VKVEPNVIHDTRSLVPPESWARAQQTYANRWEMSMAVRMAWDIPSLPLAKDVAPASYSSLGWRSNWGNVAEVQQQERSALLALDLVPVTLKLQPAGRAFDVQRAFLNLDEGTKKEIARMATNIRARVAASGTTSTRTNPLRTMPESELQILLYMKLKEQDNECALCGGALIPSHANSLLRWSPDRIDSSVAAYDDANMHIVHLGCNLAKRDATMQEFGEWVAVLRGSQ
jgi:hypothetical protein